MMVHGTGTGEESFAGVGQGASPSDAVIVRPGRTGAPHALWPGHAVLVVPVVGMRLASNSGRGHMYGCDTHAGRLNHANSEVDECLFSFSKYAS